MAPIADGFETNDQLAGKKYVRVGEKIAYQDLDPKKDTHLHIAWDYFPDQQMDEDSLKLIVDDKGEILVDEKGNLMFTGRQEGTVLVQGDHTEARSQTIEVARKLFGTERVG